MSRAEDRFKRIKRLGMQTRWTQDLYHSLMIFSWRKFFLAYVVFFIFFNATFAALYWSFPGSLQGTDNSFWNAFAFSVQTFSTVGYGAFAPHEDVAHIIVIAESILSVFVTAVLTGLIFAKFSRPRARIIFSKNILISHFEGRPTLMLRMGNLRNNHIAEAQVHMMVLKSFKTIEGQTIRRQIDLNLVRNTSVFFALTWSVMHVIDELSPLHGLTSHDLKTQNIDFGISVIGYDSTFNQTVHANHMYGPDDVIFDKYFEDVMTSVNGQVVSLDYSKFDLIKE